ncbi:MAG: 4-(cytidine 5'-diphospho)-2-C-methyl-D-erythritol kinase [Spirochaetales bacterium]
MNRQISIKAFGKINIGLDIGYPRLDGYHPILSIFHSLEIFDTLMLEKSSDDAILVEGSFDCPMETTTIYKAAELFKRVAGVKAGIKLAVKKEIPTMAGLGGGSVDAAATLVALNALYDARLDRAELGAMAAQIGSDVPFFLAGGAAIVSGRGEIIKPIEPRNDFGIILVWPGFGISTAWAYAALDSWRAKAKLHEESAQKLHGSSAPDASGADEMESRFRLSPKKWGFSNSFGEMLYNTHPVYLSIEMALRETGADFVSITGSGSCMYGIYSSNDEARGAEGKLKAAIQKRNAEKTLYGMALRAIKPLETSLLLG